jgi:spore coat polysaccharide biosynthesis protein SpsF
MTLYIKEHPEEFQIRTASLPEGLYRPEYRLTVDEAEDVTLMQALFARLADARRVVTTREAIRLLDCDPSLAALNTHLRHKAANLRSVALDRGILRPAGRERSVAAASRPRARRRRA